jgi:hypothetical protein
MKFFVGCGRGSNPASRKNLRPPKRNYFVLEDLGGGSRQVVYGPATFAAAYREERSRVDADWKAGRTGQRFSAVNRSVAVTFDPAGVDRLEAKR